MGATEEQMQLLSDAHVTHVSYILILYSIAFLLYLLVNMTLHVYATHAWPDDQTNGYGPGPASRSASLAVATNLSKRPSVANQRSSGVATPTLSTTSGMNGTAGRLAAGKSNASRKPTEIQQVRDAEEFELEGLISDVEADEGEDDRQLAPAIAKSGRRRTEDV